MKRLPAVLIFLSVIIVATSFCQDKASTGGGDEQTILAAEQAWAQAPVRGDADAMASYMADDYVEIVMENDRPTGKPKWVRVGKSEWVQQVRSGREKYASVKLSNLQIHFHDRVATVAGEYSQTGTKDGKDIGASGLYVNTWVKKNGKWLVVSSVFP